MGPEDGLKVNFYKHSGDLILSNPNFTLLVNTHGFNLTFPPHKNFSSETLTEGNKRQIEEKGTQTPDLIQSQEVPASAAFGPEPGGNQETDERRCPCGQEVHHTLRRYPTEFRPDFPLLAGSGSPAPPLRSESRYSEVEEANDIIFQAGIINSLARGNDAAHLTDSPLTRTEEPEEWVDLFAEADFLNSVLQEDDSDHLFSDPDNI